MIVRDRVVGGCGQMTVSNIKQHLMIVRDFYVEKWL